MPASGSIDFWWPIVIATIIALTLVVAVIGMVLAQQRSKIISTREKLGIIETSERRYGTLFNNVTDIVYIHTPDGTILQANDAAFSLLRLRQDQVIGRKLSDFVPQRYQQAFRLYLLRFHEVENANDFSGILPFRTQADETVHLLEFKSSMISHDGQEARIQGIARDITARLLGERELRRTDRKLRALLVEAQFMQERLSQLSQSMLRIQEEDRKTMSRSLHDDIGHILATVMLNLEIIGKEIAGVNGELKGRIAETKSLTEQAIGCVRRFLQELRPEVLDQLGLIPSIRQFSNEYSKRTGIEVNVYEDSLPFELDGNQQLALYRIIQESLTNTARHSHGRKVWIDISGVAHEIIAQIRDDGEGFNDTAREANRSALHLGILSMQERAKLVGGEFSIWSQKNQGTLVTVRFKHNGIHSTPSSYS